MKFGNSFFIICTFLCSSFIYAQEEEAPEMITDRPDETEAPSLVPKGFLQIETGVFYEELSENLLTQKITGYNTTLLRYGLLENLELRLGGDLAGIGEEVNGQTINEIGSGLTPLLVGAKIGIAEEKGFMPQIGFLLHLRLPFAAAEAYKPETTGIDFRFAFSHELSENSNLSYNLGAEWLNDDTEATYVYTLAYGYELTENLELFAEIYGDLPENDSADHYWDGGLTYNVRNNLQLDAYVGMGINNSQDLLLGGGVSYRIPY